MRPRRLQRCARPGVSGPEKIDTLAGRMVISPNPAIERDEASEGSRQNCNPRKAGNLIVHFAHRVKLQFSVIFVAADFRVVVCPESV